MKKPIIFALLFLALGFLSGVSTNDSAMAWYYSLNKSSLTPPDMVFPIVWTILYVMLGLSFGILLDLKTISKPIIRLFTIQMLLNFLWSPIFFGLHHPTIALCTIILMDILVMIILFKTYIPSKKAFILIAPYSLWLLFATYLNLYIVLNN